jgi:hypothetical protein
MNNNNNNYPGQVEQMAAQAASNILEVKPAIPGQAAPRRAAPGQSRAASPRSARPGPGPARRSAQTAPAREPQDAQGSAPVRERRAGFDWGKLAAGPGTHLHTYGLFPEWVGLECGWSAVISRPSHSVKIRFYPGPW